MHTQKACPRRQFWAFHTLKWINSLKKKFFFPAQTEFCLDSIHQDISMSNLTLWGFLLQRHCSNFKLQKDEVFSKVEADVSHRTSLAEK